MTENEQTPPVPTGETTSETMLRELGQDPDSPRWNEFVRIYTPILERFVRFESGDTALLGEWDRKDLVQSVLVSMARVLPNFTYDRSKGRFHGFLRLIVRRMVWRARKRNYEERKRRFNGDPDIPVAVTDEARREEARADQLRVKVGAMATYLAMIGGRVRPGTRAVFQRHVVGDVPAEEVARQFRIRPNAVRQIKHRVLGVIQSEIREAGHGTKSLDEVLENLTEKVARIERGGLGPSRKGRGPSEGGAG